MKIYFSVYQLADIKNIPDSMEEIRDIQGIFSTLSLDIFSREINLLLSYASGAVVEFVKELEDIEVPESLSGELECIVSPENLEGKWYHNDVELKSNGKYTITSRRGRQNLTVKDVTKEDQGEYSFVVDGKRTTCKLKMKREFSHSCWPAVSIIVVY